MKKILVNLITVVSICGLFLLSSCASNEKSQLNDIGLNNDNDFDVVTDSEQPDGSIADGFINNDSSSDNDFTINKIEKKSFWDTWGTSSKFCEYDAVNVFTPTGFGGLKKTNAVMVFVPSENTFGFGSNYMAAYYYVHFEKEGRDAFINAVNSYFKDFENKRLQRNNKKSLKAYGSSKIFVNWGAIKASCSNNGEGIVTFGYKFVEQSPYFTMNFMPVHNKKFDLNHDVPIESMNVTYYFTKDFCRTIAKDLTDNAVAEVISQYMGMSPNADLRPDSEIIDNY